MNIEERVQIAILSKYYGKMLTERQQDILKMYVDNNLSLAEVSEELGISRQAVKDALDNSMLTLKQTEEKLGAKLKNAYENIKNRAEELSDKAMDKLEELNITEEKMIGILLAAKTAGAALGRYSVFKLGIDYGVAAGIMLKNREEAKKQGGPALA